MTPVNNYRFSPQFVSNASELRASSSLERKTFTVAAVSVVCERGSWREIGSQECILRVYNGEDQEMGATRVDDFAIHRFSVGVMQPSSVSTTTFSIRISGSETWMKTEGLRVVLETAVCRLPIETSFEEIESACCEDLPSSGIPTIPEEGVLRDFFLQVIETEKTVIPTLTLRVNRFFGPKSSSGSSFRA